VPLKRTTSARRPAAARALGPTAMIRPANAATSGVHPAKRSGSITTAARRNPGKASDFAGRSQAVRLGDDLLHDLVGPGADPSQPRVAPRPLDWKLAHVAVTAEDLDRLIRDIAGDLGRQELGL